MLGLPEREAAFAGGDDDGRSAMRGHASRHVSCIIAADGRRNDAPPPPRRAAEKNQPLVDDIRLLGRILGDVIREQEGKDAFELVERVRQLSVAYRLKRDAARRPRARPAAEEPVAATRRSA